MIATFPYIVQPGDTMLRISGRFGINEPALLAVNPRLTRNSKLMPGLVVIVPAPAFANYCIQPQDTLPDLAMRLQVSVNSLLAANPQLHSNAIAPGQTIQLPHHGASSRTVRLGAEYGYGDMCQDIEALLRKFSLLQRLDIGQSVMGRLIPALRLGSGSKRIHINAAFHANEWITTPLIMRFIEELALAHESDGKLRGAGARQLLKNVSLWIVPIVNPDGVELVLQGVEPSHPYYDQLHRLNGYRRDFRTWKANIRGVDLNDQFPAHWQEEVDRRGQEGPGPRDYPGPQPLSEPEAAAIAAFTQEHAFDCVVALHTQGQEIYWNYREYEPPESEELAKRLAAASGYRAVKLSGSDAGYKDWFIQEYRKPGFTVEAGLGINPLPLDRIEEMYEEIEGLLLQVMLG